MATVKVLVVDDAPEVRRLLSHRLPIYGSFEIVAEAVDGEDGIAQARAVQPDLIVLDVLMPGRSGIEVAPEIRAAAPEARILLYSSLDTLARANPSRIGVDVIVDKAERLGELEDALAALFPGAMEGVGFAPTASPRHDGLETAGVATTAAAKERERLA